jgi:hypothetical protein
MYTIKILENVRNVPLAVRSVSTIMNVPSVLLATISSGQAVHKHVVKAHILTPTHKSVWYANLAVLHVTQITIPVLSATLGIIYIIKVVSSSALI